MGELDTVEYFAFVSDENDSGLCFDCEPIAAQSKPEIFRDMLNGDRFVLGDYASVFVVESHKLRNAIEVNPHARALSPGLSSYTKLNRNTEFAGVLEYLYDHRICPGCDGLSFNHDLYGFHPCEICGDKGEVKVLKKWVVSLIGGVVENV